MEILSLPNEVLCHIFSNDKIVIGDLKCLMLTCKRFLNVIGQDHDIWRRKFAIRWPRLFRILSQKGTLDWPAMVSQRWATMAMLREALPTMSRICYPEGEPPVRLMGELLEGRGRPETGPHQLDLVEDSLIEIIFHGDMMLDLTPRFYARKLLRYLRTKRLEESWRRLQSLPPAEQSLLEGAMLISSWAQMDEEQTTSVTDVEAILDGIARRAFEVLGQKHKNLKVINDPKSIRKALECLNCVFYEEMGFQGNIANYHSFANSYVDRVLETRKGIPITLCIIYLEVAKRLGVQLEPVSFPQHFLLRWREFPEREASGEDYTYVDTFNGGASHLPRTCPALIGRPTQHVRREAYQSVEPGQVFRRMVNNLIQYSGMQWDHGRGDQAGLYSQLSFSRLACAVSPGDTQLAVTYAEICVLLGVQLEEAANILQSEEFQQENVGDDPDLRHLAKMRQISLSKCTARLSSQLAQSNDRVECHRPASVQYAVGLVMRHVRYNYDCVIAFWDSRCRASDEWMERMGVHNLTRGADQPFYHVLVQDGSTRYAAEENLEIHPEPVMIAHPDVGRHFQCFDGRRYVANAEKAAQFPRG